MHAEDVKSHTNRSGKDYGTPVYDWDYKRFTTAEWQRPGYYKYTNTYMKRDMNTEAFSVWLCVELSNYLSIYLSILRFYPSIYLSLCPLCSYHNR